MTERQVRLTDPRALRAYAHPTRMTLVGLLRGEGPFTATRAAELTGESVASCSYHLRMLAKYGLVEEADPDGPGREKPWRATAEYTEWPRYSTDPVVAAAAEALTAAAAETHFHRIMRHLESRASLPREWQEADRLSDSILYLTPEELVSLGRRMDALVAEYAPRTADPAQRPADARRVTYLQAAYLAPELPDGERRPGDAAPGDTGRPEDASPEATDPGAGGRAGEER